MTAPSKEFVLKLARLVDSGDADDHLDAALIATSWLHAGWFDSKIVKKLLAKLKRDALEANEEYESFSQVVRNVRADERRGGPRKSRQKKSA
jgi:hypothetical protein